METLTKKNLTEERYSGCGCKMRKNDRVHIIDGKMYCEFCLVTKKITELNEE